MFALPEDTDYLAIAPAVLTKLAARYGAVRVGFTGALTPEQLARYGKGTGVQGISAADAHSFLAALDADTALSPRCQSHCHQGNEISLLFHCLLLFYVYILVLILA